MCNVRSFSWDMKYCRKMILLVLPGCLKGAAVLRRLQWVPDLSPTHLRCRNKLSALLPSVAVDFRQTLQHNVGRHKHEPLPVNQINCGILGNTLERLFAFTSTYCYMMDLSASGEDSHREGLQSYGSCGSNQNQIIQWAAGQASGLIRFSYRRL